VATFDPDAAPPSPEAWEILLVEYQKAQDSAEHHDGRVSNVTNLWVGTAVLMGFVLSALTSKHGAHDHWWVLMLLGGVGIALTLMAWAWSERANKLKRQKYARCKELERELGMRQHLDVDNPPWWHDQGYRLVVLLFVAGWVGLLVDVYFKRF